MDSETEKKILQIKKGPNKTQKSGKDGGQLGYPVKSAVTNIPGRNN